MYLIHIVLVISSRIPIEYVDGIPLLSYIEKLSTTNSPAPPDKKESSVLRRFALGTGRRTRSEELQTSPETIKESLKAKSQEFDVPDLTSPVFSKVFSSNLKMKRNEYEDYTLESGSLSDILHYCLLISTPELSCNILFLCYQRWTYISCR